MKPSNLCSLGTTQNSECSKNPAFPNSQFLQQDLFAHSFRRGYCELSIFAEHQLYKTVERQVQQKGMGGSRRQDAEAVVEKEQQGGASRLGEKWMEKPGVQFSSRFCSL